MNSIQVVFPEDNVQQWLFHWWLSILLIAHHLANESYVHMKCCEIA